MTKKQRRALGRQHRKQTQQQTVKAKPIGVATKRVKVSNILTESQKYERKFSSMAAKIKGNIEDTKRAMEMYENLAKDISTIHIPPLRFSSDDIEIDLRKTLSEMREGSKADKWTILKRMEGMLEASGKQVAQFRGEGVEAQRVNMIVDMLVTSRKSDEWTYLVDKIVSKNDSKYHTEDELFYATAREGYNTVRNKHLYMETLNARLRAEGYSQLPEYLFH